MQEIWKFKLEPGENSIEMPWRAKVLTVQMQNDDPYMWAVVDPMAVLETRHFDIIGTGRSREYIDPFYYIGTFQMMDGMLVWHVFETFKPKAK